MLLVELICTTSKSYEIERFYWEKVDSFWACKIAVVYVVKNVNVKKKKKKKKKKKENQNFSN